jgi:hypothetical protein
MQIRRLWQILAALLASTAAAGAWQSDPTDDDFKVLIAYGQTWRKPDQLYRDGLPESVLVNVASGRAVRFMTDRARICIEACRAKLLLKPFGVSEARAIFKDSRLHAILEASSMTRNGAARAAEEFGGRDINMVLMLDGEMIQPIVIGGATGESGPGLELTRVSRAAPGFFALNTMDLTPGFLSRPFTFEPPAIPTRASFILVNADGKKRNFTASLLPLRPGRQIDSTVLLDYPLDAAVKPGKPAFFRVQVVTDKKTPDTDAKIIRAESVWRTPTARGSEALKVKDLPITSVFAFHATGRGGVYEFELATDGMEPGRYGLRANICGSTKELPFNVK